MRYLLDTNILLRLAQRNHTMHKDARECLRVLLRRKDVLRVVPQVMIDSGLWRLARFQATVLD